MALSIFQLAPNDQAVYYLGFIFGSVGNVLTPASGGAAIGIIGTMLKVLNLTALTVGVLVVVYITVVGVLATAHEGQFMGKDWSGLWVPIKTILGIVALFPSGSGYSIIQILIMWIVIQGVAAGDTMWTTVLNYVNYSGSPYATVAVPTIGLTQPMQTLFQGEVCQADAAFNSSYKDANNNYLYWCNPTNGDSTCRNGPNLTLATTCGGGGSGCTYAMGPSGSCGTLTYCDQTTQCQGSDSDHNQSSLNCAVCKVQQTTLQSIVTYFNSLGNSVVAADSQYLQFWGSGTPAPPGSFIQQFCSDNQIGQQDCCYLNAGSSAAGIPGTCSNSAANKLPCPNPSTVTPGSGSAGVCPNMTDNTNASQDGMTKLFWPYVVKPLISSGNLNPDIIKISTNLYADALAGAFTTWIATQPQNLNNWQQSAQQNGWLLAGTYYFAMSQQNNSLNRSISATFNVVAGSASGPTTPMNGYRNNFNASQALLTTISQAATGGSQNNFASSTNSTLGGMGSSLSSGASEVVSDFMNMLGAGATSGVQTNALAGLQAFGTGLLNTADAIWFAFVIATIILSSSIGWSALVIGTGPENPMGVAVTTWTLMLMPVILALLGFLYAVGGLLAVYTPLIPYIVYTMGAIGWMIGVIEAMVAGPLIGLGILSPGKGGHEILGKAEPALMGMFGLFLRPSLMIVGMVAAMMLSAAAVTMVNSAFAGLVGTIVGANPDPAIAIFFMAAYVSLILSVLNKCFALIHIIPDRVLAWMGGQHAPGGGHGEAGEALKGAEGKIGGAASAAGAAAGMSTKGVSKMAGDQAENINKDLKEGGGKFSAKAGRVGGFESDRGITKK